jgi:hypothetical protein
MNRHRSVCIPSQLGIFPELLIAQNRSGREVIFEMSRAQLALRQGNLRNGLFKTFLVHDPTSKLIIELRFLLEEPIADRHGLLLHGIEELADATALFGRQIQFVGQFQQVRRTRMPLSSAASASPIPRPSRRSLACWSESALIERVSMPASGPWPNAAAAPMSDSETTMSKVFISFPLKDLVVGIPAICSAKLPAL